MEDSEIRSCTRYPVEDKPLKKQNSIGPTWTRVDWPTEEDAPRKYLDSSASCMR